ncbi:MAG: hypothetical protein WDO19_05505 [Bacteroidota bacterium]
MQRYLHSNCHQQNSDMATRFFSAIIIMFFFAATGCRKDDIQRVNCEKLQQAIIAGNPYETEIELTKIFSSLPPGPDTDENFKSLTKAVSAQCNINAVVLCHSCIKTNPVESEIKLSFTHAGTQKHKIIDISYSENKKYVVVGMHD